LKGGFAMLLLVATPTFADRNDFSIEYFTLTGTTARALSAEIDAKGPFGEDGRRSDGYTHWAMNWSFGFDSSDAGCTASRVVVDLDILMTLPRWTPPPGTDAELLSRWNRYIAALRIHEDGHRYRAETAARDMRQALLLERPAPDCDTLRNRLDSRANGLLDDLRKRQAVYDRETAFGQKQGVIRP
jgi:predicted secreted Zn-dependent protease